MMKKFPETQTQLKKERSRLLKKEFKLKTDLAIKKCPKLEEVIVRLVICVTDLSNADKTLNTAGDRKINKEAILKQIEFYENKILGLKASLDSKGTLDSLKTERELLFNELQDEFNENVKVFEVLNLDVTELIPGIDSYMEHLG